MNKGDDMTEEYLGEGIKLIVSEIDGVITDGKCAEDEIGNVLYKVYNTKDFGAMNEIKKNFKFVFLSDDNRVNYNMCRRRNITFYWGRNEKEKYDRLVEILHRYSCTPDQTIYIGAKMSDKRCLRMIPKSLCPDDVGEYLKNICFANFIKKGGEGILIELNDLLNVR